MKDVAKAAGVSQPAVSYAYTRPEKLSKARRNHILETARRIGYPGPNVLGRSLRSGKICAIGLMMMDKLSLAFEDPSTIALLRGLGQSGAVDDFALTLFPLNYTSKSSDELTSGIGSLAVRGLVDGVIVTTLPDDHPVIEQLLERRVPFVIVDSPKRADCHFIGIDDCSAASSQMRHILDMGHRRIGVLVDRLNPDNHVGPVSRQRFEASREAVVRERLRGYVDTAADFGLRYEDLVIFEAGGLDNTAGQSASFEMLHTRRLTAMVTTSDVMALSCLKAARDLEINVPSQLSVIGFDDIPEALSAGLTTVRQPMVEKGVIASQFMRQLLDGDKPAKPMTKLFETRLILRSTTRAI